VKVCDPGQAVVFSVGDNGVEQAVPFGGLVGKSFRPPELHEQKSYLATKVDSWCLGWSTFYLLTAQPLFMSADPAQQDSDWLLFQQGDFASLFQQKSNLCSPIGLDFIFRLLNIDPHHRMSVADALNHQWLKDPKISPVMAPKEFLPESLENRHYDAEAKGKDSTGLSTVDSGTRSPGGGSAANVLPSGGSSNFVSAGGASPGGSAWAPPGAEPLRGKLLRGGEPAPRTPILRVRSPPRSLRNSGVGGPRIPTEQQRGQRQMGTGRMYIATEHSPPPHARTSGHRAAPLLQTSPTGYGHSAAYRTSSPAGFAAESPVRNSMYRNSSPAGFAQADAPKGNNYYQDSSRQAFVTPRSASKPSSGLPSYALPAGSSQPMDDGRVGRTWTFKSDGFGESSSDLNPARIRGISPGGATPAPVLLQPRGGSAAVWPPTRLAQSPARSIYFPRSSSPGQVQQRSSAVLRTHSPGLVPLEGHGGGFSWAQAPTFSPRPNPPTSMAAPRTASPVAARYNAQPGFAWSPEPPSPHTSPRALRSFHSSGGQLRQWSRP
jgi:hypothetical protein